MISPANLKLCFIFRACELEPFARAKARKEKTGAVGPSPSRALGREREMHAARAPRARSGAKERGIGPMLFAGWGAKKKNSESAGPSVFGVEQ